MEARRPGCSKRWLRKWNRITHCHSLFHPKKVAPRCCICHPFSICKCFREEVDGKRLAWHSCPRVTPAWADRRKGGPRSSFQVGVRLSLCETPHTGALQLWAHYATGHFRTLKLWKVLQLRNILIITDWKKVPQNTREERMFGVVFSKVFFKAFCYINCERGKET